MHFKLKSQKTGNDVDLQESHVRWAEKEVNVNQLEELFNDIGMLQRFLLLIERKGLSRYSYEQIGQNRLNCDVSPIDLY